MTEFKESYCPSFCPKHPEVWLYENMMETAGFCTKCQKWYDLPTVHKEPTTETKTKFGYIGSVKSGKSIVTALPQLASNTGEKKNEV